MLNYMDISKCVNENCPKKEQCYRYTCPTNEYNQSYAEFEGGEDCKGFWNNIKEENNGK